MLRLVTLLAAGAILFSLADGQVTDDTSVIGSIAEYDRVEQIFNEPTFSAEMYRLVSVGPLQLTLSWSSNSECCSGLARFGFGSSAPAVAFKADFAARTFTQQATVVTTSVNTQIFAADELSLSGLIHLLENRPPEVDRLLAGKYKLGKVLSYTMGPDTVRTYLVFSNSTSSWVLLFESKHSAGSFTVPKRI